MRCRLALLVLAVITPLSAVGQPSTVTRGEHLTIEVEGEPFYPLGWNLIGHCSKLPEERFETQYDSLVAEMDRMRGHSLNAAFEADSGDGRYLPHQVDAGRYNWYGYTFEDDAGNTRHRGHIRPGIYVAALKRYLDLAYFGTDGNATDPIRTFVSLNHFTIPEGKAEPHGGSDLLRCEDYRRFIEEEQSRNRAAESELADRIPDVSCDEADRLPFWEWNVRYIVQNLRDHPGLLAWYLWDEPEGVSVRHLFGITQPGLPAPRYTGPESLPTPDLLRYVYQRVIDFELEDRPPSYQRHPILVDVYNPDVFFSNRFAWSREGELNPSYHSGPFDRAPDGSFNTPADMLGLDTSVFFFETAAYGDQPAHGWYWDLNLISRNSEMLREAAERDDLWSALVISGQSWLAHGGPFGVPEQLRCPQMNDRPRLSLLNDRDIVWQLLTTQINGLRGQLYYARAYNPVEGVGAEQVARTDRAMEQFQDAGFDRIFSTPMLDAGWSVASIDVEALTNYFRSDPDFVGPADHYDPGASAFQASGRLDSPSDYRADAFTRSSAPDSYGHPVRRSGSRVPTTHGAHELLRTAFHRQGGDLYVFVSNAYDAQVSTSIRLDRRLAGDGVLEEGLFDLNANGEFSWRPASARARAVSAADGSLRLRLQFEPYEARVFRIGS